MEKAARQAVIWVDDTFHVCIHEEQYIRPLSLIPARHAVVELQLIKHGVGAYFIKDRTYQFQHDTLLVIPSNVSHCFSQVRGGVVDKISVLFDPRIAGHRAGWQRCLSSGRFCLALDEELASGIHGVMRVIARELAALARSDRRELIKLKLAELLFYVKRAMTMPPPAPAGALTPVIANMMDLIDREYAQPLNVGGLARNAGYSRGYLTGAFKRYTGLSLKRYILRRRIVAACRLLQEHGNLKINVIAQNVGFHDYGMFHAAFKSFAGCTPAEYRTFPHLGRTKRH